MQDPSAHSPGPLSPLPPTSVGEISIPPPSDDIEEMLPVGFSELDAIAASPVPDVELLPPPPTTNSNSRPSSPSLSSYMPAADGYSDRSTADSSTLPEASDQDHDLTTFDVEKGFWRVSFSDLRCGSNNLSAAPAQPLTCKTSYLSRLTPTRRSTMEPGNSSNTPPSTRSIGIAACAAT